MVASVDVVDPRKTDGAILYNLDAVLAQGFEVALLQRLVVGVVAKPVEHGTNLYTLLALHAQNVEEEHGDRVVAEVEVFQVDAALGLHDGVEHVVELLLTRQQQGDAVVVREADATVAQRLHYQRIAGLRFCVISN